MAKVHIVQCLYPARHCIMGLAWEEGRLVEGAGKTVFNSSHEACCGLRGLIEWFIRDHQIDPWCAICKSRQFSYEDGVTKFNSLEEAMPHIRQVEAMNLLARAAIDQDRAWENQ